MISVVALVTFRILPLPVALVNVELVALATDRILRLLSLSALTTGALADTAVNLKDLVKNLFGDVAHTTSRVCVTFDTPAPDVAIV